MFRNILTRLLIILQIYSNMFQGVAHGVDLADYYPINDEIHLHSYMGQNGLRYLDIGTGRLDEDSSQLLEHVLIPGYASLKSKQLEDEEDDYEGSEVSTDDEFESENGISLACGGSYFTLQGLTISVDTHGVMQVTGKASRDNKPVFLISDTAINLDNVQASSLKLHSPKISNFGNTSIDYLRIGSQHESQNFTNFGELSTKELFLNNLASDNQGKIVSSQLGVYGNVEHFGAIEADKLSLSEAAFFYLNSGAATNIKSMFLSQGSQFHNDNNTINVEVLHSSQGILSNTGVLTVNQVTESSIFDAIVNRHWLVVGNGEIITKIFENNELFTAKGLKVDQAINSGLFNTESLSIAEEFKNQGLIKSQYISGKGELTNAGEIESKDHLQLEIYKLRNQKQIKAKSITALDSTLENEENAGVITDDKLNLANVLKLNNLGLLKSHNLSLNGDKTTQEGFIEAFELEVTGGGEFTNAGDIDVEKIFIMDLKNLVNIGNIEALFLNGYKNLVTIKNDVGSMFRVRDGTLEFSNFTIITNDGTIEAQDLKINTDRLSLNTSGKLKAANITLSGSNHFTNSGTITAGNKLSLNLNKLTNQKNIKAPIIDVFKITEFANAKVAIIDSSGDLIFSKAKVINDGLLKVGVLEFRGGALTQNGTIEGKSLKTIEKTVVNTSDSQTIRLSGELASDTNWSIRGQVHAKAFTKYGDLDLYGILNLKDSFRGYGTVHKGGKLTAKIIDFYNDAKIDGNLEADTLNAKSTLILNGNALVKKQATVVGYLKVGRGGKLQGFNGSQLSLNLNSEADIDGLVDVDDLTTGSSIELEGQLLSRKQTRLKNKLEISKYAKSELNDLTVDDLNITNHGSLQLNNQKKAAFTLYNHGKAQINGGNAYTDWDNAIKILLKNSKTGHLTIKKGTFNISRSNSVASENEGTFVDDTSWIWFGGFKNTGLWTSPSSRLLFNYSGQDMGNYQVNGELHVNSLVDGIKALDGLHQTKTKKVILNAPQINTINSTTPIITKKYPWYLELRIAGDINNSMHIHAPKFEIQSRNLKTTGDLFATSEALKLEVENLLDINAKVGGNSSAEIKAKHLKLLGKDNIAGASAPSVIYKRNGNGIYSNGEIILDSDDLIENTYGIIQGTRFKIAAPKLINLAGLIKATEPSLRNKIEVKDIKNIRDEPGLKPVFSHKTRDDKDCRDSRGYCAEHYYSGCPEKNVYNYYPFETSDEGVIFTQGDLTLTYNYLEMLVSRITCGGKLTFKAENQSLVYNGNLTSVPGNTKMIARNSHNCHVIAKNDIKASLGSGDITSSFNGANIFVDAFTMAWRGADNQSQQTTQMINLSSTRTDPLPISPKVNPPKTMVAIGDVKDAIVIEQELERVRETFERNYYTIYRGVGGLGLNPDQLFNSVFSTINQHVRGLKGTKSQTVPITWDGKKTQIEVLTNKNLTKQNLLDLNKLSAFIELFAQNINALESEQKANAVVQGIFPAHEVMDGGKTEGDIKLISQYGIDISTNIKAEKNAELVCTKGDTKISSRKHFHQDTRWTDNYYETLSPTNIEIGEKLRIAGQNIIFNGANTKSGEETKFETPGHIQDVPISLVSQKIYYNDGWNRDKRTHQVVSTHQSGGNILSNAGGKQELYAPTFETKKRIEISGAKGVDLFEVHDTHEHKHESNTTGGFGGKKTSHTQSFSSTSKGANLKSEEGVKIVSGSDINLTNVSFIAPKIVLQAVDGVVRLLLGTNYYSHVSTSSSSSAFWQSQSMSQKEDKTFSVPKITGDIEIY